VEEAFETCPCGVRERIETVRGSEILVIKIGGSTLGSHDTTLADVAELHHRGEAVVVLHGGGALITEWLKRLDVPTRFERGLRVTDQASLDVVVAVLAGLVNKQLVASLSALGVTAVGLSGCDAGMLKATVRDKALGFVGEIVDVDAAPLVRVMMAGGLPVIAPVGLGWDGDQPTGQLLNINADTAAGDLAAALQHSRLALMTDVPGVLKDGQVIRRLSSDEARGLIASGVVEGGMIPKVEACLAAATTGNPAVILDGRQEHALLSFLEGEEIGTVVG
jgi:acetylglutamate kinase